MYAGINAALVLAAVSITTRLAPAAAGSGIAEVKVCIGVLCGARALQSSVAACSDICQSSCDLNINLVSTPLLLHIQTCSSSNAGSHIAINLQAYLNGIDVPGIFLLRTLLVKLAGSVGAVAGGLAVGKEGPFVHAGAAIGALLSQVRGKAASA